MNTYLVSSHHHYQRYLYHPLLNKTIVSINSIRPEDGYHNDDDDEDQLDINDDEDHDDINNDV